MEIESKVLLKLLKEDAEFFFDELTPFLKKTFKQKDEKKFNRKKAEKEFYKLVNEAVIKYNKEAYEFNVLKEYPPKIRKEVTKEYLDWIEAEYLAEQWLKGE